MEYICQYHFHVITCVAANYAYYPYSDQPVGVGFSYANSDYVYNEAGVSTDVYIFLQQFFTQFPQFQKNEFFVIGESYGGIYRQIRFFIIILLGHYVPAVSAKIVQQNAAGSKPFINIQGSAIGNGWVDPYHQYAGYGPYA